jgi:catechol 2,3-dioxygenase-like lactoylglutathione lyase family enzyme
MDGLADPRDRDDRIWCLMAQRVQVAIDCHDPDRLAEFWAAVLGYECKPPPGFDSWSAYSATVAEEPGECWSRIVDADGVGPNLLFHRVPEAKTVKNRLHLDVRAPEGGSGDRHRDIDAFVERIVQLGGRKVRAVVDDGGLFVVMHDPEGNEFCTGGGGS